MWIFKQLIKGTVTKITMTVIRKYNYLIYLRVCTGCSDCRAIVCCNDSAFLPVNREVSILDRHLNSGYTWEMLFS